MRRSTLICREGWYYLIVVGFVLAGALLREINLLMVLFGMLIGPFLFSWQLARLSVRDVKVTRRAPRQAAAGQTISIDVELANNKRKAGSWAVVVEDVVYQEAGPEPGSTSTARLCFSHVAGKQKLTRSYEGRLASRGRYRLGPLTASSRFPLGLLRHCVRVDETSTLIVYPRIGHLTRRWNSLRQEAYHGSRQMQRRRGLVEGDFHGLRDWRSGDATRWIHWRTSARQGELMVREFEQHREEDLAVLLDLWQPASPTPHHKQTIENAISFAATILSEQCRRGGSHLLLARTAHKPVISTGSASLALLEVALEGLATAEAFDQDHLPAMLTAALAKVRPRASVVLVSTRAVDLSDTERFVELWQDPRLRRWAGRVICLDASSSDLDAFFRLDQNATTGLRDLSPAETH